MKIEFKDNIAIFEIDFNLYDYPSIIEAAKEFTEVCWVSIRGAGDGMSLYVRMEPKDKEDDIKEAVYSFFNYILGIMNGKIKNIE